LGDTRVLVNGVYAALLSASPGQVEFICPALPARTPLDIAVETPSGRSNSLPTVMEESAPAIFTVDGSPQGPALAVHTSSGDLAALPDFRLHASPAEPGERISVRATGIECTISSQLWMNLGGQPVAVDSAQPVPQMAGICELAFRIPENVSSDSVSLVMQTLRSDAVNSSSNRTTLALRSPSTDPRP
jgi:uncharacterized protein (TIGR03437 family)